MVSLDRNRKVAYKKSPRRGRTMELNRAVSRIKSWPFTFRCNYFLAVVPQNVRAPNAEALPIQCKSEIALRRPKAQLKEIHQRGRSGFFFLKIRFTPIDPHSPLSMWTWKSFDSCQQRYVLNQANTSLKGIEQGPWITKLITAVLNFAQQETLLLTRHCWKPFKFRLRSLKMGTHLNFEPFAALCFCTLCAPRSHIHRCWPLLQFLTYFPRQICRFRA